MPGLGGEYNATAKPGAKLIPGCIICKVTEFSGPLIPQSSAHFRLERQINGILSPGPRTRENTTRGKRVKMNVRGCR